MNDIEQKTSREQLGFWGLMAVAISGTVASGVFSLAGDFPKEGISQGGVIIGWIICGLGMFGLMRVFFGLSYVKPELKGGIYSFARAGFGEFVGFFSAWGYWISTWLSLVALSNLLFSSIGYFIPFFGVGNSGPSVIGSSIYLWILVILTIIGVEQASFLNVFLTAAKMVPLFLFILLAFLLGKFQLAIFLDNFWGDSPILEQVASTSLITLWVFVGIEGAVVVSNRAKKMSEVAKASAVSFFFVLILYAFISLVSMGVMSPDELAELPDPNLAYVMEAVVGTWGATLMNIGVIVSLMGGLLAVLIEAMEVSNSAAKMGSFCRFFEKENKNGSPINSLILSMIIAQILLIITYFNESTFQALYYMTGSTLMLPYLLSALFYAMVVFRKDGMETYATGGKYTFEIIVAIIAVVYGVWLVYAAELKYLLANCMFYMPGILVYMKGKSEKNEKFFKGAYDYCVLAVVVALGVLCAVLLITGKIELF